MYRAALQHFRKHALEHELVLLRLDHQLLELRVLGLQFPQQLRFGNHHASVLRPPIVEALFGYAMITHQIVHPGAGLMVLEDDNDIIFAVSLALHVETSLESMAWEISH